MKQITNKVFLVQPAAFSFNVETAVSNSFQQKGYASADLNQAAALAEFKAFAQKLASKGIEVHILEDTPSPIKPDAIFPNNWISVHADGCCVLYPMCTPNRRLERRADWIAYLQEHCKITNVIDFSSYEQEDCFLEGTGSIVFDHQHKIAYACLSPRTDQVLFEKVTQCLNYKAIYFEAVDPQGKAIYHTNVMMSIGDGFAVLCLECIQDDLEKEKVLTSLVESGLEVVEISMEQVYHFAGNMLALEGSKKQILVLSQSAYNCLNLEQKTILGKYCDLLPMDINLIEKVGGGSARCMIAELFC